MSSSRAASGVDVRVDQEQRVAYVYAWGAPSPADYIESTISMLDNPAWQPGMNLLVDYRQLSNFGFSVSGIRDISALFNARSAEMGDGRCAVVTPSLFLYGLFRMWKPWLPDSLKWDTRPFRDYAEACDWVGAKPTSID